MRRDRLDARCALVVSLLTIGACTAWHGQGASAEAVLGPRPVDRARITLTNGNHIVVRQPRVAGDSVIGYVGPDNQPVRTAIPTYDIRLIETRKFDPWRSGGLAIGVFGLVSMVGIIVILVALINGMG